MKYTVLKREKSYDSNHKFIYSYLNFNGKQTSKDMDFSIVVIFITNSVRICARLFKITKH